MSSLNVLQFCRTIQLTDGLNTLVDDHPIEYRILNSLTWGIIKVKGQYPYPIHQVRRARKISSIKMHQFIMNPDNGVMVDHKNRDTLDNRRENLRVVSRSYNCANASKMRRSGSTSKFKGVSVKSNGKYEARITKDGKTKSLGTFANESDAAKAYDDAAREIFGDSALTNEAIHGNV